MMSIASIACTGWAKKVTAFWYFEFPPLLDELRLQFLFTRVSFLRATAVPAGTAESAY